MYPAATSAPTDSVATREPFVRGALKRTEIEVVSIAELVGAIAIRLEPVMRPSTPPTLDKETNESTGVPIADSVSLLNKELSRLRWRLDDVLQRLEV